MYRITTICFLVLFSSAHLLSQTAFYCENCNVNLRDGVVLYVEGDLKTNVNDLNKEIVAREFSYIAVTGDIIQDGSRKLFREGDRTRVVLKGTADQRLRRNSIGALNFYDINIEQGSNKILEDDISVNRQLRFFDGNVNLNGNKLDLVLDPSYGPRLFGDGDHEPTITSENVNRRVFGTTGGVRLPAAGYATGYFNSYVNVASIGFEIRLPGLTQLSMERARQINSVNSTNSIQRHYDVVSTNGSTGGADVRFNYLDGGTHSDIPPATVEEDLVFFKQDISSLGTLQGGASWFNDSLANIDITNDVATNTDIENLTDERFTLVECQAPEVSASATADSVCVNTTVTLDAGTGTGWTYLWSNGETTQTIDVTENFMVTKKFYVIVNDSRGCFARDSLEVSWLDLPTVSFGTPTETVCDEENIDLNPTITGSNLSYLWSTGETTPTISHLSDGTQSINYSVTVTSYGRCEAIASVQVNDLMNPPLDLGPDIVECEGLPQTISAGPAAGFVYDWRDLDENMLSNSNEYTISETGFYTVSKTEIATGCSSFDDIRVGISDIQLSFTKDDILCNGSPAGNVYLTIAGISGDFAVDWSNGAGTVDLMGVVAGTYSVTVSDMEGCSDSIKNIVIAEPTAITPAPVVTPDLCDLGTGSIITNLSGGVQPYAFIEWYDQSDPQGGPFATTPDVSGLTYGFYNLSVIDDNGCQFDTIFEILGGPINPSYSPVQTDISCPEAADGMLEIQGLTGGNAPYSYSWSNGATTAALTDLGPGTYSVTATDVNDCVMLMESFTLTEPEDVAITLNNKTDVSCSGDATGSIDVTVVYSGQYSILWTTGAMTESITSLTAGTYTATISFGNGCERIVSYEITEPDALADDAVITNDFCSDGGGSISTNISGGTGLYEFVWSNGEMTPDISGLTQGEYSVTITDENSCSLVRTYQVNRVPSLVLFSETTDEECSGEGGGSINVLHTGGTLPITYDWTHGVSGRIISDLEAGDYTVLATDVNGCTDEFTSTINAASEISAEASTTDASSTEVADGAIDMTVFGGAGGYDYIWSNGETSEDISNLAQGVYGVTITDTNDCLAETSFVVGAPTIINSDASIVNPLCNGDNTGSIDLSVSGGNMPYSYSWSDGSTEEDLAGLEAGEYTVTIVDSNGATTFQVFSVVAPAELSLILTKVDVTCNGEMDGSISAAGNGGTGDLSYTWSNGASTEVIDGLEAGIYTVTMVDENSCATSESIEVGQALPLSLLLSSTNISSVGQNDGTASADVSGGSEPYMYAWSNGEIGADISGLSGGEYLLTVTDNQGCTAFGSVIVLDPSSLMISAEVSSIACFGDMDGNIDLNINGGSEPLSYLWSNNATTEDIENLGAGDYSVTVTDGDGLQVSASYTITQAEEISVDEAIITDVDCGENTGAIAITVSGGSGDLSYAWFSGETTSSISEKAAGTYTVSITDENECVVVETYEIVASTEITISSAVENTSCGENFDGGIDITVEGGTEPYSYLWSTGQLSEDLSNLGPGLYMVTVTDANMCSLVAEAEVMGGGGFTIAGEVMDVTCFNANDAFINLTITGGTGDFTYLWSNGATTPSLENLDNGSYSVTVTDDSGCAVSSDFAITEPDALVLNVSSSLAGCSSENDGSIAVDVSGGGGMYTYMWSTGAGSAGITGLSPGTYSVTVTDGNGCSADISSTVSETDQMLEARFLVASPVRETETLQFLDLSFPKPNSWLYKFGNPKNTTSVEEDPLFRYPNNVDKDESTYTATLIVSSVACIDSTSKDIRIINTRSPGARPDSPEVPVYTEIQAVKVYPNPVLDYLNTEVTLNQADEVEIRLVNLSGQIMRHYKMSASQVYYERISVQGLVPGYYFVYVTSGGDTDVKKVSVVR